MPSSPDATGYLYDLAKEVAEPWFTMICDLAVISGPPTPVQDDLDTLFALFTKRASYLGSKPSTAAAAPPVGTTTADFLENLSGFSNFKLLAETLDITFRKRITIVFGTNGSGKSSLCESLKVLASPEIPGRPLQNVRGTATSTPTFRFKFKSDTADQSWTKAAGYGPRQASVKYFDTAIAHDNVKIAVEPGRVIVLTPFKLHVFESVKSLTTTFREMLQRAKQANATERQHALEAIRLDFRAFTERALASIDENTLTGVAEAIATGEAFTQHEVLKDKQATADEMLRASSEQGLKLLKAEHRELEAFLSSLRIIKVSAERLWDLQPVAKARHLAAQQAAQQLLAKALIPDNGSLDSLLSLLRAAAPLCNFESAVHQPCPLCKRQLDEPAVALFKRYHDLLAGDLENEIVKVRADLTNAAEHAETIGQVNRTEWEALGTLPEDLRSEVIPLASTIIENCTLDRDPSDDARTALASLKTLSTTAAQRSDQKAMAIKAASSGREELLKQSAKLRAEIEPLQYAEAIGQRLDRLRDLQRMADNAAFWNSTLSGFTPLLKKITESAKKAYEQLVVTDFEARLDAEYKALTEKSMTAFGVTLARKGTDASVTVVPHIRGEEIVDILSEGEQRVHALSLFFAELETCSHSVLVFDDPISSFDYNYITNFCARLRDHVLSHPDRQVIALTHNWEFFVQLQTTMNQAGLNGQLSVQVLENCAVVADYSEKTDELKADITAILAAPGEPAKATKEEMAGKMRRLIEAIVNTHVFNNQRHQYKQKSQPASEFHQFTKVVPLLSAEATTLRDLYAKLSTTEHDDPRNAYVNTDKAMFQGRYDAIIAVEAAVVLRK